MCQILVLILCIWDSKLLSKNHHSDSNFPNWLPPSLLVIYTSLIMFAGHSHIPMISSRFLKLLLYPHVVCLISAAGFCHRFFRHQKSLGKQIMPNFLPKPEQGSPILSYEVFLVQWFQFFWPQLLCKESTMALPNCWKWHPQGGKNQGKVPRLAHCDTAIPKRFPKVFSDSPTAEQSASASLIQLKPTLW